LNGCSATAAPVTVARSDAGIERRPSIVCILIAVCLCFFAVAGERKQFGSQYSSAPSQYPQSAGSSSSVRAVRGSTSLDWRNRCGRFGLACRWRFGVYSLLSRSGPTPFQNFTITQVTNTGKAQEAAISPDGKYVLNVQNDNGMQSLWLRNVPTGSDTQIVPRRRLCTDPWPFRRMGITFTSEKPASARRVSGISTALRCWRHAAGDCPRRRCRITFSPDGHHMAYARANDPMSASIVC